MTLTDSYRCNLQSITTGTAIIPSNTPPRVSLSFFDKLDARKKFFVLQWQMFTKIFFYRWFTKLRPWDHLIPPWNLEYDPKLGLPVYKQRSVTLAAKKDFDIELPYEVPVLERFVCLTSFAIAMFFVFGMLLLYQIPVALCAFLVFCFMRATGLEFPTVVEFMLGFIISQKLGTWFYLYPIMTCFRVLSTFFFPKTLRVFHEAARYDVAFTNTVFMTAFLCYFYFPYFSAWDNTVDKIKTFGTMFTHGDAFWMVTFAKSLFYLETWKTLFHVLSHGPSWWIYQLQIWSVTNLIKAFLLYFCYETTVYKSVMRKYLQKKEEFTDSTKQVINVYWDHVLDPTGKDFVRQRMNLRNPELVTKMYQSLWMSGILITLSFVARVWINFQCFYVWPSNPFQLLGMFYQYVVGYAITCMGLLQNSFFFTNRWFKNHLSTICVIIVFLSTCISICSVPFPVYCGLAPRPFGFGGFNKTNGTSTGVPPVDAAGPDNQHRARNQLETEFQCPVGDAPNGPPNGPQPNDPQPITQPITQPVEPVTPPVTQPVEPVVQPVAPPVEPVTQPVTQPVEPVTQPDTQPVVQPVAPPVEPVTQPVTPPVEQPVEPVTQPVTPPVEPVVQPVAPPVEPVTQPVTPPVEQPVEPVTQPVENDPLVKSYDFVWRYLSYVQGDEYGDTNTAKSYKKAFTEMQEGIIRTGKAAIGCATLGSIVYGFIKTTDYYQAANALLAADVPRLVQNIVQNVAGEEEENKNQPRRSARIAARQGQHDCIGCH